jgi:peptidoglycan-associated lipoprotein
MNRERFINQDIFFEFDSSVLSAEAQTILKAKAEWMMRNAHLSIIIEGHCDNRGTTEYNLALGERRAEGVKRFMQDLGVPESRIRTLSFGEERPLDLGNDEAAWAKNRRAHFEFD